MGKGSKVRPRQVSRAHYEAEFDRIFASRGLRLTCIFCQRDVTGGRYLHAEDCPSYKPKGSA